MSEQQKIVPFLFEGEQMVRVVERDGAPWFLSKDVCAAIAIKNHRDAVTPLDEDEKGVVSIDTLGGPQEVIVVSEGGLYTLVLRSRDATTPGTPAHRFRRWVTAEVLPAIRKTGRYAAPPNDGPADEEEPQSPDSMKLRKVNTAARCFGERAGAQLWAKLGLDYVPAMAAAFAQGDLLEGHRQPVGVTVTVTQGGQ